MTCFDRLIGTACLFGWLVAAAACGGDGGNATPISIDEMRERYGAALCGFGVRCKNMPDLATCKVVLQGWSPYRPTIDADIASGKVIYDGIKARACIEFYERVYGVECKRSALAAVLNQGHASCDSFISGTVAPGDACSFPDQCAGGGSCPRTDPTCSPVEQCCTGTCVAKPADIPIGGDCSARLSNQTCAMGSVCASAQSGASPTCLVPATVEGASCVASSLCPLGMYCDIQGVGVGTCKRPAKTGASCNPTPGIGSCDEVGDTCNETSATCTPKSDVGGPCDNARDDCLGYASCLGATCAARPGLGEACAQFGDPYCLGALKCDAPSNMCVAPPIVDACN